jgi:hypothetical protein
MRPIQEARVQPLEPDIEQLLVPIRVFDKERRQGQWDGGEFLRRPGSDDKASVLCF